jgi:hypothetical protein
VIEDIERYNLKYIAKLLVSEMTSAADDVSSNPFPWQWPISAPGPSWNIPQISLPGCLAGKAVGRRRFSFDSSVISGDAKTGGCYET